MSLAASVSGSVKRHGSVSSGHSSANRLDRGHSDSLSHDLTHSLSSSHHNYDSDWEAKEELRMRELEEARARAAQMEKTMRWWSDCTTNWREKWSKARTERNKAREEARLLRTKLEVVTKENNNLKREKQELESELDQLRGGGGGGTKTRSASSYVGAERLKDTSPCRIHSFPESDVSEKLNFTVECDESSEDRDLRSFLKESTRLDNALSAPHPSPDMEFFDRIFHTTSSSSTSAAVVSDATVTKLKSSNDSTLTKNLNSLQNTIDKDERKKISVASSSMWEDMASPDIEFIEQRLSELQLRLDESTKTIQAEREEKSSLNKDLEKLQQDHNELKMKYEEIKMSKQETLKELSQVKAEHQDELESIRLDLEDEANSRSSMDRRLNDLRAQLEHLQAENAAEWGKRERLETEKLALERENKKLRTQIEDLEERLQRKTKHCSGGSELDAKTLQHELHDKNKELADLRHSHNKLKKVLQDKTTELAHAVRRAEQYETEVKKLRSRVEELKKELAIAEDEVDSSTNNIRKLQRSNDELQEQLESLQVQVDHLQTRLRNSSHSLLALRGSDSLLNDGLSEDDNAEF